MSSRLVTLSLFLLAIITGIALVASAVDIIIQSIEVQRPDQYLFIGLCYFLLAVAVTIISLSRYIKVRIQLKKLSSTHVPITKEDLTGSMFKLIHTELDISSTIALRAHPTNGHLPWIMDGKKKYAQSVIHTLHVIEDHAIKNLNTLRHPDMSARSYICYLVDQSIIMPELAERYLSCYEQARFGNPTKITQAEHEACLKIVSVILKDISMKAGKFLEQ